MPTRPRLQALNRDFSDLDDQIDQAARIIRLPNAWDILQSETRLISCQQLVKARADWVLRWILEKLSSTTDAGAQARANPKAWKLLEWMVLALPTSHSATHLRGADFLTILEKALEQSIGTGASLQPAARAGDKHAKDISDSSETAQGDPQPSRKRKRGSGANTPSKRAALDLSRNADLFNAVKAAVETIRNKAYAKVANEDLSQAEHMRMVLRTESAQAARILKQWLTAVQVMIVTTKEKTLSELPACHGLSLAIEIWESRVVDAKDTSGASTEEFSTECLIPSLLLLHELQNDVEAEHPQLSSTCLVLDHLVAKHILIPSRSAFFNALNGTNINQTSTQTLKADLLSSSLESLQAKLLQAAQIEDAGESIPLYFTALFAAVPRILDLIIRFSPARGPRTKVSERPWMQASLIALAQCVGCSFEPPDFLAPKASIAALEQCITILASHDISVNSKVLTDLFWYHSGLRFPVNVDKEPHWSFIAAMVGLDPFAFLQEPNPTSSTSTDKSGDLISYLFNQLSVFFSEGFRTQENGQMNQEIVDDSSPTAYSTTFRKEDAIEKIIVPLMSAYSKNRKLLVFLTLWDDQLRKASFRTGALGQSTVFAHQDLSFALDGILEKSLTVTQILGLVKDHAERIKSDVSDESLASAVIIKAVLYSVHSDEIIAAMKEQLISLWKSFESWALNLALDNPGALLLVWTNLCKVLELLWTTHLHNSAHLQKEFILPLLEKASKDAVAIRKNSSLKVTSSAWFSATMSFIFTACNHLQTVPDTVDVIRKRLRKPLKTLSTGDMKYYNVATMTKVFCAQYSIILDSFDPETAQALLSRLLDTISQCENTIRKDTLEALSDSIFAEGKASVQSSFVSVILNTMKGSHDDFHEITARSLLKLNPLSLSREQRENILDQTLQRSKNAPEACGTFLSIMVQLMELPNATAKISVDSTALYDLAKSLHNAGVETASNLQLLQVLARSTLTHLLPNRNQTQSKQFLDAYKSKIGSILKKPKKCFPALLAILTATLLATDEDVILLTPAQYLDFLRTALDNGCTTYEHVLEVCNQFPLSSFQRNQDTFDAIQASARQWLSSRLSFNGSFEIAADAFPVGNWAEIYTTITKYQLYPKMDWLLRFTSHLLRQDLSPVHKASILRNLKQAALDLKPSDRLDLAIQCLSTASNEKSAVTCCLLNSIVSTLGDKLESDFDEVKAQQLALLPQICSLLGQVQETSTFNSLLDSIHTIICEKPGLTSQHSIECLLVVLLKLVSRNSPRLSAAEAPRIYERLCETARLILLLHRGRLRGRFHLLLPVLQGLLLCLFIPHAGRGAALPPWLETTTSSTRLTPANASQYTHLLSTLCSPTQSSVQRAHHSHSTTLNDPIRAAREYASQYVYGLLSAYCRFQLYGKLDAAIRAKLAPGIWEVVGVGNLDKSSLDAMFAGLGRSEKDVWRGVWGDWVRIHGRKERKDKIEQ